MAVYSICILSHRHSVEVPIYDVYRLTVLVFFISMGDMTVLLTDQAIYSAYGGDNHLFDCLLPDIKRYRGESYCSSY